MQDASHLWGGDLFLSPTGDIALASGTVLGQQRVIRRLMTNLGDYIWQLGYGAGLPAMVGTPAVAASITAVIRSQMALEPVVAVTPEPVITVAVGTDGTVYAHIQYVDAASGQTQILQVPVQ